MFRSLVVSRCSAQVLLGMVLLSCMVALPCPAWASAKIRECSEGDVCRVNDNNIFYVFHFMGIDAPEIDQPYGRQAQKFVKKTLMNLELNLHCDGGFLQKKECKVTLPDGQDVSALLVQSGFAWDNPKTSYGKYKGLQKQAQEAKVGLWADEPEKIISPYCWRTPSDSNCQNPHYQP